MTPSIISTFTTASQLPTPPTPILSLDLQSLPTFASVFRFEDRVKLLEVNFSNIPDRLQDSIQRENDEFLKTIDDNMKKIIKEQVKTQVKAQVTRILPRIEESVNAQLEAEVLTRSSNSSRTLYAVAADLSEMELKKILIDKMEGNKSIQRSDGQRNLYKALVEAYDADKTILDIYGESTILKRRREDEYQEGPSAGLDRGSKRRRGKGEHASASTPSDPATGSAGRSTTGTQSRQLSASESAFAEEPVQTTCHMEEPSHPVFETGAEDPPIVQTSQHPKWFSQPRKPPTPDRNKSIQRSDEQRNLYKALFEAYDADKAILDTYGDSTILKRRREDDDQEGPSAGSNRGSKRQKKGGEHASASTPSEKQPRVQSDLPQGLNLDKCLPVSLLLQKNLCRLLVRWRNPHIRCLR
nr:hypothetical protein [Tanacetum cinerariifolium]